MALVDKAVESFGQNVQLTKKDVESVTGKKLPKKKPWKLQFCRGDYHSN